MSALRYAHQDLLTAPPATFHSPAGDYGQYETRPVYGYDDCFPTVDPCDFPTQGWPVPDHGELCWLPWEVTPARDQLAFHVKSELLPVIFTRRMSFQRSSLNWLFEVINTGNMNVPFLHVMHCLMPLREVAEVRVPEFSRVVDEAHDKGLPLTTPRHVEDLLLSQGTNKAWMLLLQGVKSGSVGIAFKSGLKLEVRFPLELFPTLGIWWNNGKYPDEEGCRRVECAFEPIPGPYSSLAKSFQEGAYLLAPARASVRWTITWNIT
ncbi:MAG: hypothetical protein LAP13_21390 [Acidobacteriia bacterium]|nr:hypothetical protein [Terriglobia bacterium]